MQIIIQDFVKNHVKIPIKEQVIVQFVTRDVSHALGVKEILAYLVKTNTCFGKMDICV